MGVYRSPRPVKAATTVPSHHPRTDSRLSLRLDSLEALQHINSASSFHANKYRSTGQSFRGCWESRLTSFPSR